MLCCLWLSHFIYTFMYCLYTHTYGSVCTHTYIVAACTNVYASTNIKPRCVIYIKKPRQRQVLNLQYTVI